MPDTKYLRAIFGTARQLGISEEDIRDAAFVGFSKTSLRELTDAEARQLLDRLNGKAHSQQNYARRYAQGQAGRRQEDRQTGVEHLVNAADLQVLRSAAELRGWSQGTLDAFVQRQLKGPIRTIRDLNRVLWAVKAMNRRDGLVGKYDRPANPAHA